MRPIFLCILSRIIHMHVSTCGTVGETVPVLASPPFFGLMGVVLGSVISFSLPFRLIGLREGVLPNEGKVAWMERLTNNKAFNTIVINICDVM